ncbi:MAG: macrolide ABC transporter permease [Actinobacteria bacterium 69-20]|nr:ABC transporter permease [Actinomycetota bacterium]OJV23564.1 MAG: macrolide ABC transporter permease [Actinobacteria bacterium 69-20]
MNWVEILRTAGASLVAHRLRSALTVLGILIGIAAVVLSVGLGLGSQQQVGAQISALGSNLLIVTPGSSTSTAGIRGGFGSASTLTVSDATALANRVAAPDIAAVAPEKDSSQTLAAGSTNWTTSVIGTTDSWLGVRSRTLADGDFFTATDVENASAVTVLGSATATELFGTTNAVGQTVTINSQPFTVVGVLASAGSNSTSNLDDEAVMPITALANDIAGGSTRNSVSTIYLKAASQQTLSAAYQEADALLLNLHRLSGSANADFTISSQNALLATVTSVSKTLTVLLAGIAALSLLVGGIGVMNIMLVSVTERTREIGLRKAIGAPPTAIRRQFLAEAIALGLTGGLLGALLGILGARLLPTLLSTTTPVIVSAPVVIGAVAVSMIIGLIFGVYPATRAARMAPIDALRTE